MTSSAEPAPARADAARLASIPSALAGRFRDALCAAGYLPAPGAPFPPILEVRSRGGRNLPRLLHATASLTPLDVFVRLFLLGVAVPEAAARSALTDVSLDEWADAGLLAPDSGEVRPLLTICPYDGLLLAFDKPESVERGTSPDHVCGLTNSTVSMAAFMVHGGARHVLDIGTGCGVLGFLAVRNGGRLLATDLNPRALQFASFNARLNGIADVEFALGSGFEPVRGMKFDLVLSNPPCVLGPVSRYAYRDSGMELDSLCRQIVAAAPGYLNPSGMFQCSAEWPDFDDAPWERRPSEWLRGTPCDALVIRLAQLTVQQHCDETACDTDLTDTGAQARLYAEFASYFAARNVTAISEGLVALRGRRRGGAPQIRFEALPDRRPAWFGDAVARYFSASDALEDLGERLWDCRPGMAPGLSFGVSRLWLGNAWEPAGYAIRQTSGFGFQATVDERIAGLIRECDGTRSLGELAADLARSAGVPLNAIAAGCLEVVGQMVRRGFLSLDPPVTPPNPRRAAPDAAGGRPGAT